MGNEVLNRARRPLIRRIGSNRDLPERVPDPVFFPIGLCLGTELAREKPYGLRRPPDFGRTFRRPCPANLQRIPAAHYLHRDHRNGRG